MDLKRKRWGKRKGRSLYSLLKRNNLVKGLKDKFFASEYGIRRMYRKILQNKAKLPLQVYEVNEWVQIEINNYCNLNCIMCKTGMSQRAPANMDLVTFEKAVALLVHNGIKQANLFTVGEPLVNPQLEEYFRIMQKYDIKTQISTNGQLLDKKLDLLIKYANLFTGIRFSIDGATQKTYEKIRFPGIFNKLLDNLDIFTKENNKGHYFSNILIDSIVSKDVQSELAYHLQFYSRYTKMNNIGLHLVNGLSPDNSYFFENSILPKHIIPMQPCNQVFGNMHVLVNGDITTCCRDYYGNIVYGNIHSAGYNPQEFLNTDRIIEIRKMHLHNKMPQEFICASCYQIKPDVAKLFAFFAHVLTVKYQNGWDVKKMQTKFDHFFVAFEDKIPSEQKYVDLI